MYRVDLHCPLSLSICYCSIWAMSKKVLGFFNSLSEVDARTQFQNRRPMKHVRTLVRATRVAQLA